MEPTSQIKFKISKTKWVFDWVRVNLRFQPGLGQVSVVPKVCRVDFHCLGSNLVVHLSSCVGKSKIGSKLCLCRHLTADCNNYLRIVWAVIVLLGLCCTVHYVLQNWKRFLLFDSIVVQRSFDYYASKQHNLSTMYPIIVVCANSMHSKDKLLHYENGLINTSLIEAFYGNELYLPFLVSTL